MDVSDFKRESIVIQMVSEINDKVCDLSQSIEGKIFASVAIKKKSEISSVVPKNKVAAYSKQSIM